MDLLAAITWNVHPEIVNVGFLTLRWYGLLFALAFLLDYHIVRRMFALERKPMRDLETLTIYVVVATIIGARLGHCLFYDPGYYLSHPMDILYVWQGGLASHGGALGILTALFLYTRSRPGQTFLWAADRIAVVAALSGSLIRLGNLFNSEIYGKPTDLPWGFIFSRVREAGVVPRHPTQLYESLFYLLVFVVLFRLYEAKRTKIYQKHDPAAVQTANGDLLGLFMVMVFGFRFFIEFLKENQSGFENALPLNMGQLLSIPFVTIGIILFTRARRLQAVAVQNAKSHK